MIKYSRKTGSRKYKGKCEMCNKETKLSETYCYVDDTCASMNYYAPYLCKECYENKYGKLRA